MTDTSDIFEVIYKPSGKVVTPEVFKEMGEDENYNHVAFDLDITEFFKETAKKFECFYITQDGKLYAKGRGNHVLLPDELFEVRFLNEAFKTSKE